MMSDSTHELARRLFVLSWKGTPDSAWDLFWASYWGQALKGFIFVVIMIAINAAVLVIDSDVYVDV